MIKDVKNSFDGLKTTMQEEKNIENSIDDIFKEKSSDEEKIPDDGWTQQDIEEGKNLRKTNEEELKELKGKKEQKEVLEKQLELKKQELVIKQDNLKRQLKALHTSININEFKDKLKKALENVEEIITEVDKMKKAYEEDPGINYTPSEEKTSITNIFARFEKMIGDGFLRKKQVIEIIHDVLESNLDKDGVTIEEIEKIINGSDGNERLDNKLIGAPGLLINITNFLLEDAIYNKALLENQKYMAAAEKHNTELEQARLKEEEEVRNKIKEEEERRKEAERQAILKAKKEEEERIEAERLRKLAIAKEKYEKNLTERQNYFEEAERNYNKLLSKYDESRYSKQTQDLNDALMETIFKSGLLYSDQTYQEEDKPGHRKGVEDWFDTTTEGIKMMDDDVDYEHKLKKYNEAMKKTNEIFG